MRVLALTPRARADLDEIWDYTAAHWDAQQAEHYVRRLWDGMQVVARNPRRGTACDDIRPGFRRYRVASHVLFYRVSPGTVEVIRILHAHMDFDRHL